MGLQTLINPVMLFDVFDSLNKKCDIFNKKEKKEDINQIHFLQLGTFY